ncbi:MAG: sulfur carrier protein ThiS [Saprospiraceae bacterium]|nr:sulfur carrier protein ThiS [Pyrinomonadaceae bacterium]
MNVILNGEKKEIPSGIDLESLLTHLSLPVKRVAIELNKEVVRRKDWESIKLSEADRIEVVHFVGGG